ncbi:hypothetical protein C8T65DRAFT_672421 [Cerioporus squamosus]|nr:hypothetical protein C8T65DRAFT_672421 [Cerioporus squamosus]
MEEVEVRPLLQWQCSTYRYVRTTKHYSAPVKAWDTSAPLPHRAPHAGVVVVVGSTVMALVSPPSRCEALLIDEETCCNVPIRFTRGRFCNAHGREYVQLTQAYKSVSKTVEELKKTACLTRPQMRALQHTVEVDMAIGLAKEWREAIAEEIRGRQVQHRRFFVTCTCAETPARRVLEVLTTADRGQGHQQPLLSITILREAISKTRRQWSFMPVQRGEMAMGALDASR